MVQKEDLDDSYVRKGGESVRHWSKTMMAVGAGILGVLLSFCADNDGDVMFGRI